MSESFHYDAAWDRILDLQREAENRRLIGQAYPGITELAFRRIAGWSGSALIRLGGMLSRNAQPCVADECAPETA